MHLFASYKYFIFGYYLLARAKRPALYVGWSQARHGTGPNTKSTITHSFFEQQTPDFAQKCIWKVQTNYKSTKNTKKYKSTKLQK